MYFALGVGKIGDGYVTDVNVQPTNAKDIFQMRAYSSGNTANLPSDAGTWGWFIQIPKNNNDILQILFPYNTGNVLFRTKDAGLSFDRTYWMKLTATRVG